MRIEVIGYDLIDKRDVRDINQLDYVVRTYAPDRILHLAAIARFADADNNPKLANETNIDGTQNVVAIAQKYHVSLVFASTGSVYMPIQEKPPITEDFKCSGNSVYGSTKYMGELYVQEHTPHIILRYAHLYGAEKRGHGLIGGYWSRIKRGLEPQLYGGQQSNDFTYVKDVANANLLALTSSWDKWNQTYNIGTGEELTAQKAGRIICDVVGYKGKVDVKKGRTVDPERFVFDTSKAERMLGFKSQWDFERGLKDMKKGGGFSER